MPTVIARSRSGQLHHIEGTSGGSLMEVLRNSGIDGIAAICGGACSCATCHVYVSQAWFDRLQPPGADEHDLLDGSQHRKPNSRLSCQIPFGEALDGMHITVAPED